MLKIYGWPLWGGIALLCACGRGTIHDGDQHRDNGDPAASSRGDPGLLPDDGPGPGDNGDALWTGDGIAGDPVGAGDPMEAGDPAVGGDAYVPGDSGPQPPEPYEITATDVLVIFNDAWPDEDGNGQSDSRDVAEYYALRRGVPANQLLAVTTATSYDINFEQFHADVLTPVVAKLNEADGSGTLGDRIVCLLTVYGLPVRVNVHFTADIHPLWPGGGYGHDRRALDQWLLEPQVNQAGGYDANGWPLNSQGGYLGDDTMELSGIHFGQLRIFAPQAQNRLYAFKVRRSPGQYLVSRIDGPSARVARSLVDKALYAERHLVRSQMLTLIDSDKGRNHGHESHAVSMTDLMQGLTLGSPFEATYSSEPWFLGTPWPLATDWGSGSGAGPEVGEAGHLPTVVASIDAVDSAARTIHLPQTNAAHFFVQGEQVTSSSGGTAVVTGVQLSSSQLELSTTSSFVAGDTVTQQFGLSFPLQPTLISTFYAYGAYRDVYAFPVGAFGKHMDSGSGVGIRSSSGLWCAKALIRNITSTSGAVAEPSAAGEAYMDSATVALLQGFTAVEAWHNAIYFGNRWMALVLGDPLYAPFASFSAHVADVSRPVIDQVLTDGANGTSRQIDIAVGGPSADHNVDVCQFRVEYGTNTNYGTLTDYETMTGPFDGNWDGSRDFFYARDASIPLTGLASGQTYHYRVWARDPAGNESVTGDYQFVAGGSATQENPGVSGSHIP